MLSVIVKRSSTPIKVTRTMRFGSVDELPPEARRLYDEAMAGKTVTRIEINGRTYSTVDEMPPEDRRPYEMVAGSLASEGVTGGAPQPQRSATDVRVHMTSQSVPEVVLLNSSPGITADRPAVALLRTVAVVAGFLALIWLLLSR